MSENAESHKLASGAFVLLRRLTPRDLDEFLAYRSDPEVARYQSWDTMNRDDAHRFLAEMECVQLFRPGQWTQIAIAQRGDNRLLGDMGVYLSTGGDEAEIGITLARSAQGRGLAADALALAERLVFDGTETRRIVVATDSRNMKARALIARMGYRSAGSESTAEGTDLILERLRSDLS